MMKEPDLKLLEWIGEFLPDAELQRVKDTINKKPFRITDAYKELFSGYNTESAEQILSITAEIPDRNYTGLISGLDIRFLSFCEHHFLPFHGLVDLIYDPDEYILGIGKLSRLVDYRTSRFNIQEKIAKELCEDLISFGKAKGAFARVKAYHTCLCYRGPKKHESSNVVTYAMGSCLEMNKQNEIKMVVT
jgi:GTP cyclohydrolase I